MTNKLGVVLVLFLVLTSVPVYAETNYDSIFDSFLESFSMFFKFSSNSITGNQGFGGLGGGDGSGGTCIPLTYSQACTSQGISCGTVDDNCGGTVDCGTCNLGVCYNNRCCMPLGTDSCDNQGFNCGTLNDNCGGTLDCGTCASDETCVSNVCTTVCVPDCTGKVCGDNGCGGSCGTCASDETCVSNVCIPDTSGGNEDCTNRADDDGDCSGDTNGDGASCDIGDTGVDCLDQDCRGSTNCYGYGYTYCESDSDCSSLSGTFCDTSQGICAELICDDGLDNDGDGYSDCDDWDCALDITSSNNCGQYYSPGGSETDIANSCGDGYDNNMDYYYDCDDSDCDAESICDDWTGWDDGDDDNGDSNKYEFDCSDGLDDDGDGDVDCDDSDCDYDSDCGYSAGIKSESGTGEMIGSDIIGATTTHDSETLTLEEKGEIATKLERMNNKFGEITKNLYQLEKEFRKAKEQLKANNIRVTVKEINTIQELITALLTDPYISDAEYIAKLESIQSRSKLVIEEIKLI